MGLMKFSAKGLQLLKKTFHDAEDPQEPCAGRRWRKPT